MSLPTDDTLALPVILAWLRAYSAKIALGGAIFALCAVPIVAMRSEVYETTATLLVFPPTFKGDSRSVGVAKVNTELGDIAEMMPRVLPMELYKTIALSPSLLAEVIKAVPLEDTNVNALQHRLEVELVQLGSRSASGVNYTQALIFRARAIDPVVAAKTADSWAQVFKDEVDSLVAKGVGDTFALLDALHTTTKSELEQAELALAEHKKAWNLELTQAQLAAKQLQFTTFEDDLKKAEVDLAKAQMRLAALDEEAAKEPEKKVYFHAPSDDAYWITAAQPGGEAIDPDRGMRHEIVNDVYVEARKLALVAKEEMEGLKASVQTLAIKLDELRTEMADLSSLLADKTIERDKLVRESTSLDASYQLVRNEYEKGRIADRTQASDIAISGRAIVPETPSSTRSATLVIVAFVIGAIATAAVLAMKEISEMAPPAKNTTS